MEFEKLRGKTVLITGATGLIGTAIIKRLTEYNRNYNSAISIIALVRNIEKAQKLFPRIEYSELRFLETDIKDLTSQNLDVNYIIHAASVTSSKMFVEHPVEIIQTSIQGTGCVLEFARQNPIESMVFLSTMEIYGAPQSEEKIFENHSNNIDSLNVRSSYPESKRMCENLCAAYFEEYNIPVKVVRLTQTFGSGVRYDDPRVFAEFARCIIEKKNIVLKTKGQTKRSYLSVRDATDAILTVLLAGNNGEAYNAANENTYCSIKEMAELVLNSFSKGNLHVIIEEEDIKKNGFAPPLFMNLDTQKLVQLGWKPLDNLESMFESMIDDMQRQLFD